MRQADRALLHDRHALYIAAVIHYHCGDHGGAKLRATNASRLGRFHGVKSWPEHASIVLARLSFLEGRSKEGIDLLEANLPGALEAGWPWTATVSVGIAAELYLAAHRPEDGLKLLESLPLSQYEGLYGPELLKVRAKLLLEGIGGSAEAWRPAIGAKRTGPSPSSIRLRVISTFRTCELVGP